MQAEKRTENSSRRYAVFLSYRHADNKESGRQWATWLHQVLEGYEIPADLVGTKNSKGDLIPANLYPVFRDEEELPADADLTKNIRQALENSALLAVLCSPRAVESRFVADEIRYFKELGKADRILALMVDGEPNAADDPGKAKLGITPEAECLPKPLRFGVAGPDGIIDWSQRTEPIAADVRPEGNPEQGWTTGAAYREALQNAGKLRDKEITQKVREYEQRLELAKLKVVAGSLGVPLGVLTERDKAMQLRKSRQRARTLRLWLMAVGVFAALALAGGIYSWIQRREALKTASATDFAIAGLKMEKEDWPATLAYLADALRQNPQNQKAMVLAVSLLRGLHLPMAAMRPASAVTSARFSPDGKWVVTASEDNPKRVWNAQTGQPTGQPMKHDSEVDSASFSPDGKWVVKTSGFAARVWDTQTGQPVSPPIQHDSEVTDASFSPDGKWVVTATWHGTVQIWDAQTGQPIGLPMQNSGPVGSASFSPDGKRVVTASTASADDAARVWNPQTGKQIGQPMRHDNEVTAASFSPDGKWVVTVSWDRKARIWDAQTGNAVSLPMTHDKEVNSASFSPDGKWVVTAAGTIAQIWNAQTGHSVGLPMKHGDEVHSASFSPDGKWMVTTSGFAARVWDAQTGQPVSLSMKHDGGVTSASFSPDGKWLVTAAGTIAQVWNAQTGQPVGRSIKHDGGVTSASFSPDGKWLVTAAGTIAQVWNAQTGQPVGQPMKHDDRVGSASFSPDGKWVVTASGFAARVWDPQTGQPVGQPMTQKGPVVSASFSPVGKWVVTASYDQTAQVWDPQTSQPVGQPMKHEREVTAANFSPDGKWVVTASYDQTARVWDARTGQPVGLPMKHVDRVSSASFSPDGKWVVTASGFTARVWNAQTSQLVGLPMNNDDRVTSASFSPDGKWVVTASGFAARVWDGQTGQPVGLPMKHDSEVTSASFSPDGKWVVTSSKDNTARVWDVIFADQQAPPWLSELAEITGGQRINPQGVPERSPQDPAQLRQELKMLPGDDDLSRFGRWIAANPATRTIGPLSTITVPQFVAARLKENTPKSIEETYNASPGNPLVLAALAKLTFKSDKDEARFYFQIALRYARLAGAPEQITQVQAMAKTLFPDAPEFSSPAPGGQL